MSETARNRLLGTVLLLPGLAWLLATPDVPALVNKGASIVAGATLGAGALLLITGEFLWIYGDEVARSE